MIFKSVEVEDEAIVYLCNYIPISKLKMQTGEIDSRSMQFVLGFKKKDIAVIRKVADYLKESLNEEEFAVAVIPSSKVINNGHSAGHLLARILVNHFKKKGCNIIDASECLQRTEDMETQHITSGIRDKSILYETLEVIHNDLICNKNVLLIDDITSSGNSFEVGIDLLKKNGAKNVICFAVGKTVRIDNLKLGLVINDADIQEIDDFKNILKNILASIKFPYDICFIIDDHNKSEQLMKEFKLDAFHILLNEKDDNTTYEEFYHRSQQVMQIYEYCIVVLAGDAQKIKAAKNLNLHLIELKNKDGLYIDEQNLYSDFQEVINNIVEFRNKLIAN